MARVEADRNKRINKLREKVLQTPEICVERGYWWTESYKETECEPPVIRRARALEKVLKNMPIAIEDDELIVGRTTSKQRGGLLFPEVSWQWYLEEIDSLSTREWNRFAPIAEEEKAKMMDFLPYWKGKSIFEQFCAMIPQDILKLHHVIGEGGGHAANSLHQGHMSVDYERVVNQGLSAVKKQVNGELEKLNLVNLKDFEKYQFLTAVNITLEAAVNFAKRYARLAMSLAKKETDTSRKAELIQIAETCDWVPENPARSFYEALQSVWLTYAVVVIEGLSLGIGFGRPDQYLFPYYKQDIEQGKLTPEEARELIALFYIKMNGTVAPQRLAATRSFSGNPLIACVTVGGLTKDGKDAVNELSYLFLDAEEQVRLSGEDVIVRIHRNTPDAFVIRACELAKSLRGKLKFLSDETTIQQLLSDGKPIEYARDYVVNGCNSPTVPGRSHDIPGGLFNLPLMLELALNNGASRLTGEQIGPKTGDPRKFKSYDEVWSAYKKQVETLLPRFILLKNVDDKLYADFCQAPFQSALFRGCIEKGIDVTAGGTAPYCTRANSLSGAPNVGDSLAAIKKAVFEDKKITMSRLLDALDKNFVGEEEILHILKSAPKFGNDDDYVDSIVNEVLIHGSQEAAKYRSVAGAKTTVAAGVITGNVPMGRVVGALPDGRKAGEPLSEGGISPHQGRNVNGPVATLRSVAKLDHLKLTNGSVLNMRFNPDALKDASKMRKFASLIRTFCETGGYLVQFNIVDTETLKDAQKHPQNYRDLLVRVATYSAYFIELSPELQSDIIARMEFQEV